MVLMVHFLCSLKEFLFVFFVSSYLAIVRSKLDKDNANISGLFSVNPHHRSQIEKLRKLSIYSDVHLAILRQPLSLSPFFFFALLQLQFCTLGRSLYSFLHIIYEALFHKRLHVRSLVCSFLLELFYFINASEILALPYQVSNNVHLYTINPLIIL